MEISIFSMIMENQIRGRINLKNGLMRTQKRTLVIVRPTVVFGEYNRGNVYNLLKQIASRKFIIIGDGNNIKSMAYVQNVYDFLLFSLGFKDSCS